VRLAQRARGRASLTPPTHARAAGAANCPRPHQGAGGVPSRGPLRGVGGGSAAMMLWMSAYAARMVASALRARRSPAANLSAWRSEVASACRSARVRVRQPRRAGRERCARWQARISAALWPCRAPGMRSGRGACARQRRARTTAQAGAPNLYTPEQDMPTRRRVSLMQS